MSNYLNYQDEIFNDIAIEFGFEATTLHPKNRKPRSSRKPLTVDQVLRVRYRYGFDRAKEIIARYAIIVDKWLEENQ
jgi:hypothetical protein